MTPPALECFPFADGFVLLLIRGVTTAPVVVHEATGERVVLRSGPASGETWAGSLTCDPAVTQLPLAVEADGVVQRMTASWSTPEPPPPPQRRARCSRKAG